MWTGRRIVEIKKWDDAHCTYKLSQIKLIKVKSSAFDKFDRYQINVVHMKSISVQAARWKGRQ